MAYAQTSTSVGTLDAAGESTAAVALGARAGRPPIPIIQVVSTSVTTGANIVIQSRQSSDAAWREVAKVPVTANGTKVLPLDAVLSSFYPDEIRATVTPPSIAHATTQAGGGGNNETQTVTITNARGGTFTLTFDGQTTAAIDYHATAAAIEAALEALSNIAVGNLTVSRSGDVITVTFAGTQADTNVAQMTSSAAGLIGPREASYTDGTHVVSLLTHTGT